MLCRRCLYLQHRFPRKAKQQIIQSNPRAEKAPDVALATRRPYFSISAETDKLRARSDSASEVGSVAYEIVVLFEAILTKINILVQKAKEAVQKSKPKQRQPKQSLAAFHTALARSSCHVPQPNPTRRQHAHNPQPTIAGRSCRINARMIRRRGVADSGLGYPGGRWCWFALDSMSICTHSSFLQ